MCSCSFHELSPPEGFAGHYDPADVAVPELREDDLAKKPDSYRGCGEAHGQDGL